MADGDVAADLSEPGIERFEVEQALHSAEGATLQAIRDVLLTAQHDELRTVARWLQAVLDGTAVDEAEHLRDLAAAEDALVFGTVPIDPDDELAAGWRHLPYPREPDASAHLRGAEVPAAGGTAEAARLG
ncbi:MAG: hypothetical protein R2713_09305 [Ilumatobacteraceae bacterium]